MRELYKFFAGVTFYESFIHLYFAINNKFPVRFPGFTITREVNMIQIILPGLICVLLIYLGWFKKKNKNSIK